MTPDPSYLRLVDLITSSQIFKPEHRPDIKRVIYRLSLDSTNSVEDINDRIKGQMNMEASMVYLLGFYREELFSLENEISREEGLAILDIPTKNEDGYKTTAKQFRAHIQTNAEVAVLHSRIGPLKALVINLENVFSILLKRNQKLEQLSINYRREQAIDERSQ